MAIKKYSWCIVFVAVLFNGCGTGITIETGQSDEQRVQSQQDQASRIRTNWKLQFDQRTEVHQFQVLSNFIDSVMAGYQRFALDIADRWYHGNQNQQADIQPAEVRQIIDNSLDRDQATIDAYDDIVEYGRGRILESKYFSSTSEELLNQKVDLYYEFYNIVFYPNSTVAKYEADIEKFIFQNQELSRQIKSDLQNY